MELLLNLVWLVIAAGAVALWLRQRRRSASGHRARALLQAIALACALAVLFPAISATDDLHAAQLAVEASDVARKVLRSMNTVPSSGAVDWLTFLPALLLLAAAALILRRRPVGTVLESPMLLSLGESLSLFEGRAPPAPLHA
jgi:hypothetical protein